MFVTKKKYQLLQDQLDQLQLLNTSNVNEMINLAAEKNTLQDRLGEKEDFKEMVVSLVDNLGPSITKQELRQLINNL